MRGDGRGGPDEEARNSERGVRKSQEKARETEDASARARGGESKRESQGSGKSRNRCQEARGKKGDSR